MQLKPIGHNCPVCKNEVFGYRQTRRYCSDTCKAKHHILAKKQLKERLVHHMTKKFNVLLHRNFYLCEGLVGSTHNKAIVNLKSLKKFKFQLSESFKTNTSTRPRVYEICNYKYWQEGAFLHIERMEDGPEYAKGYYERWLLEYPEKEYYMASGVGDGAGIRERILEMGGVWRE